MADTSLTIIGPNSLTGNQIAAWAAANGHVAKYVSANMSQLAGWYVSEGNAQGIRGDVAFAQACIETGYFSSPSAAQLLAKNNFAGIAVPSQYAAGDGWPTPQLGVRAHIQLLAKVVGGNGTLLANANVAPTWGGRQASTWGGLSGNWAADTSYASKIINVYNSMLGANPLKASGPGSAPLNTSPAAASPPILNVGTAVLPGIDPTWKAPKKIPSSLFSWMYSAANSAVLARAITTESTVDLTHNMLSQVQLTIVDPTLELTQGMPGMISRDGTPGPQVIWGGETYALEEVQTTSVNDVPAMIATLRPSVLAWMSTQRVSRSYTMTNCDWIESRVAEYNAQLPPGVTPATFTGQQNIDTDTIQLNIPPPPVQWQSYYDMATTLTAQDGYWLIETNGGVFYGKPTWLATIAPTLTVNWKGLKGYPNPYSQPGAMVNCLSVPVCLRSDQLFTGDTMTLQLPHDIGEQCRVGQLVKMSGVPYFSAKQWLITEVQWNYDGQQTPVQVTCNEVWDPVPSNLNGSNAPALPPQTDPTGRAPTATADDFMALALKQQGVPYLWGGASPAGFDCSGLVMWCLQQLGITYPHYSGSQYAKMQSEGGAIPVSLAMDIRGAILFKDNGSAIAGEHEAISMGDGIHVLEAPYTGTVVRVDAVGASYWNEAARIPELTYPGSKG